MILYHASYYVLKFDIALLTGVPLLPNAVEPRAIRCAAEVEETEHMLPHDACALCGFDLLYLEFLCPRYAGLLVDPSELCEQLAVVRR